MVDKLHTFILIDNIQKYQKGNVQDSHFLWGIYSHYQKAIERKKCARTELLLGTYAHFL